MHTYIRTFLQSKAIFLLLLIITIPTFLSLLNNAYFPIHDDQSVARLYLLDQGIRQGNLYPRWVGALGFGYGYPLFNFYPPLVYYLGLFFHTLGASYIWSIKLVIISGFIVGIAGMYFLARKFVGAGGALLAGIFYTYFTYHAVLAYVRGALAEFMAYSWLPFLFLTIVNLAEKPGIKRGVVFGICFAVLILVHPLIAMPALFFSAFFLLYYLVRQKKERRRIFFISATVGIFIGLLLSAFFWLPSILEKQYTLTDRILTRELADYKLHFIHLQQFYYSAWGFGGSIKGPFDGLSFQLGKIYIALIFFAASAAIAYFLKKKKIDTHLKNFVFAVFLLLFSLFMTTAYSEFIWDGLSFLSFLQFPWRFLTFTGIFISLCIGYGAYFLEKIISPSRLARYVVIGFIVSSSMGAIFTYSKYFKPQRFIQVTDTDKISYEEIAWAVSRSSFEFIPKGVAVKKSQLETTIPDIHEKDIARLPFQILGGRALVGIVENRFSRKEFILIADEPVTFRLNTFYFPGWSAYRNEQRIPITDDNKLKLITVQIPKGRSTLVFRFENTPVRRIANWTSLMAALGALIILLLSWPKKRVT